MIDIDELKSNYEKFIDYSKKFLVEENQKPFEKFITDFGEKLVMCPASQKNIFHLSHPGGLVLHSLNVLNMLSKVSQKEKSSDLLTSLVTISLFHDIGKLGTTTEDYYIETFDNWNNYRINEKLKHLSVPQRSLKILNDYKFTLTDDEYCAITNSYYLISNNGLNVFNLPNLAINLSFAKVSAIKMEKEKFNPNKANK